MPELCLWAFCRFWPFRQRLPLCKHVHLFECWFWKILLCAFYVICKQSYFVASQLSYCCSSQVVPLEVSGVTEHQSWRDAFHIEAADEGEQSAHSVHWLTFVFAWFFRRYHLSILALLVLFYHEDRQDNRPSFFCTYKFALMSVDISWSGTTHFSFAFVVICPSLSQASPCQTT